MDLRVRDLTVLAKSGATLLDVPELSVNSGAAIGIRGPSGAGKSTFLKALMGLAPRAKGQILWGGDNILDWGETARATFRRDRMGMVFQDFLLFDELGAGDNAAIQSYFSPKSGRSDLRAAADTLLSGLGIADRTRAVDSFSGGERQRVAVARALAHGPQILLADEPTASLHREAGDALTDDVLARVRDSGLTLIAVSHDARLLDRMDRVVTLDHGQVVEHA